MNAFITFVFGLLFTLTLQANGWKAVHDEIQTLFNETLSNINVHSASWAVYSPSKNIDYSFAAGKFKSGDKVTKASPFYVASIGKTFTATAIAMLYEQGRLNLTDKISKYLPDRIIGGIHLFQGKDYSHEITIAQLLQHTSGLPDYFEGKTTDGSANAMTLLHSNTEKLWTPQEILNIAKQNMKPHFIPGTGYQYSDTGYILLGMVIERVSGMHLHDFFKQHIFMPLNMNHTYMHLRAKPILPTSRMAEIYVDNLEISTFKSLSLDWAGGGLVSNAQDINRFQLALYGSNFLSQSTLKKMQKWIPESKGIYYGFGLRKVHIRERLPSGPDLSMIGHTGSTSSFMFYCPRLDVYLSGTLNQASQVKQSIVAPIKILTYIQRFVENEK
ncbi:serine hydrolase [Thalassotalea sp. PP2-459]|uniref:serine hydrolase domain-containing protein n=1 Tax=Thalassotalea sp. PP2-459 TaxID=1742724 RepID=UPI0009444D78|nr:serine hydrolase domain-containing protein [Thalassotalea sp. PP2-459]OKY27352.1 hypothetical protein BI291_00555 [Thalassotalea sp. PP2-459]